MLRELQEVTGPFFWPQMVLSFAVVAMLAGYAVASARGEYHRRCDQPWRRTLEPLASFAVSLGLLGSVWSFTQAFGGFQNGIDIPKITSGLGTAYATTGVGLVTSLVAGFGSYLLAMANKERMSEPKPVEAVKAAAPGGSPPPRERRAGSKRRGLLRRGRGRA